MVTVVIAMRILKQALSATDYTSPPKRLDWVRRASVPSMMTRCTVISTWYPTGDKSYTILRLVIRSLIRVSQHQNEETQISLIRTLENRERRRRLARLARAMG